MHSLFNNSLFNHFTNIYWEYTYLLYDQNNKESRMARGEWTREKIGMRLQMTRVGGEGTRVIGSGKFFSIYSEWDGSYWILSCAATVSGSRRAKVEAEKPMRQLFTIPGWRLGCLEPDLSSRGGGKLFKGRNEQWLDMVQVRECQHWLHWYLYWTIGKMRMSFIEKKETWEWSNCL